MSHGWEKLCLPPSPRPPASAVGGEGLLGAGLQSSSRGQLHPRQPVFHSRLRVGACPTGRTGFTPASQATGRAWLLPGVSGSTASSEVKPLTLLLWTTSSDSPFLLWCRCPSGAGRRHRRTSHLRVSAAAGAFPSCVFRLADTSSSSQRTDDSVLSLTSPPAWLAPRPLGSGGRTWCRGSPAAAEHKDEVLERRPTADTLLASRPVSTACLLPELCAQHEPAKKGSYDLGAKE